VLLKEPSQLTLAHAKPFGQRLDVGAVERARIALATLGPEQREAIVLHDIEGWRVEEIAELEGLSVSAVKSRLSRGRERLRDIYTRRFGIHDHTTSLVRGETP